MKSRKIISDLVEKVKVSRRSFIKGALAIGAANTVYGCSKEGIEILGGGGSLPGNPVEEADLSNPQIYTATCPHNCGTGTRCVSKVHVVNGRIVRIGTDDDKLDYDGVARDKNFLNDSRALNCAKGKSLKYKAHHPGRLKYPLQQTKARGDVTGFVRISSQEALEHVARKSKAIYDKYGAGAICNSYATAIGYAGTYNNMGVVGSVLTNLRNGSRNYFTANTHSDYSYHQYLYAYPLTGHPGVGYPYGIVAPSSAQAGGQTQSINVNFDGTHDVNYAVSLGADYHFNHNIGYQLPHVAGVVGNVVSFGTNATSTNNSLAWPYIRAMEKLKARQGKVYFIGPELTDTAVTCATEWVQLRNYTDPALIMAMFHEMIVNTFNEDGTLKPKADRWLDVNYLDTMVYGFFDSPEYNLTDSSGIISVTESDASNSERKINAVPNGKSLSAYVMGSDVRLTNATYATTGVDATYTSEKFGTALGANNKRNGATCSYTATEGDNSEYLYKKDFNTPKTPEWAEKICGTPAAKIRELAALYCGRDATGAISEQNQKPLFTEWAGGLQKQNNGVVNMFAVASLLCVTKRFGRNGEGLFGLWGSTVQKRGTLPTEAGAFLATPATTPAFGVPSADVTQVIPTLSIKDWFNGIKLAFKEQLEGMKDISGNSVEMNAYIPDWDITEDRYVHDDPGTKAGVVFDYTSGTDNYPVLDGDVYMHKVDGDKPLYAGTRLIINPGGNIAVNQHMNANDNSAVLRTLKVSDTTAETFCLVTFDPFLSPTARYSDFVLPATISLEAGDWTTVGEEIIYHPPIVKAPGETKDAWRYAYEALKAQQKIGGIANITVEIAKFEQGGVYKSAEVDSLKLVDTARDSGSGTRFEGMTRDEVYANQYLPRKNELDEDITVSTDETSRALGGTLRTNLLDYLKLSDTDRVDKPFIKFELTSGTYTPVGATAPVIITDEEIHGKTSVFATTRPASGNDPADIIGGHDKTTINSKVREARPRSTGRFQVYNDMIAWDFENRNSKWHGWLPAEKRGQSNKDTEGDPIVYSIPMYFNFEDSFNESYGVFNGKADNNVIGKNGLTLSTTHDRYRVHSTHAENPLLRELTHRTSGGKWLSGNDWKEYSLMPERHPEGGTAPIPSMISRAVANANPLTASWSEIWISSEDSAGLGVLDGDLVLVSNPIGKVRCVARITDRCMKGTANLHQGAWYDPNPIDGVDDGGCANTLMASKPSRIDNGNAQQSAYVYIEKTTPPAKKV